MEGWEQHWGGRGRSGCGGQSGNNCCLAELNAVASHSWGSGGSCSAESAGEALGIRGSGGCGKMRGGGAMWMKVRAWA